MKLQYAVTQAFYQNMNTTFLVWDIGVSDYSSYKSKGKKD